MIQSCEIKSRVLKGARPHSLAIHNSAQNKSEVWYVIAPKCSLHFLVLWNSLPWAPADVSAELECSVGVVLEIFALLPLCSWLRCVFWFHNVTLLWSSLSHLLCILLWFGIAERGSRNYKWFYLFISPCIYPFFPTSALFPKLTNVLELIEYDPLTAA